MVKKTIFKECFSIKKIKHSKYISGIVILFINYLKKLNLIHLILFQGMEEVKLA